MTSDQTSKKLNKNLRRRAICAEEDEWTLSYARFGFHALFEPLKDSGFRTRDSYKTENLIERSLNYLEFFALVTGVQVVKLVAEISRCSHLWFGHTC